MVCPRRVTGKACWAYVAKTKGEIKYFSGDPRLATPPWRTDYTEHGFRIICGLRAGKGGTGEIETYYDVLEVTAW